MESAAPPLVFLALFSLLFLLFSPSSASVSVNTSNAVPERYCSFFNNRAPRPVTNLKNCTWYRNSSCCLQREIDATFGQVQPLRGASPRCQLWLNYLICYICSPDQNHFYRRERLTVCEEVCDGFLQACGDAVADGKKIRETYNTGRLFCEGRSFSVKKRSSGQCFHFDIASHDEKVDGVQSDAPSGASDLNTHTVSVMLWTVLAIVGITFGSNLAILGIPLYEDLQPTQD